MPRGRLSPEAAHYRAVIANASLRGDTAAVDEARAELELIKLQEHIGRLVESPALTAERAERLRALLPSVPEHAETEAS